MSEESIKVNEYLERKNCQESDLILEDLKELWEKNGKNDSKNSGKRISEDFLPEGWSDWWKQINHPAKAQISEKLQMTGTKEKEYAERFLQNQLLLGWRGLWGRMEKKISRMKPE